ncbi:IS5 family transposase, partial [Escherichia coli]
SRRAKSVNISFKTPTRGEIAHLVIDSTGLKVFGEGEWKVKKHGQERRRIWRKLHLAVDSKTHEIICADLSLNNVTDSEAFPGLIRQTHRKIRSAAADGAYDTRLCHDELRRKKISALIPPRKGAGYGTVAKLAMRQPFVLFKGLTFQKLCLPGAFRPGDHHNKML